jgi:bifunctional DNA-binding transcriptional regulator/antitoxin component of YhaV-PrlF toxin-antitoxin module
VYGMTVLDRHGRLADRVVLRALGWAAGTRLVVGGTSELVTLQAGRDGDTSGASYVTAQGYIRLPARIRQRCGLWPGDRVLLAADPSELLLRVYLPSTLDKLFGAVLGHADLPVEGGVR